MAANLAVFKLQGHTDLKLLILKNEFLSFVSSRVVIKIELQRTPFHKNVIDKNREKDSLGIIENKLV